MDLLNDSAFTLSRAALTIAGEKHEAPWRLRWVFVVGFCIAIFGGFHQKFGSSHVRGISPKFGVPLEVAGDTAAAFPFFRVLFDRISLSRNVYMCIPVYPRVASFTNRETSFEPSYLEFWGAQFF